MGIVPDISQTVKVAMKVADQQARGRSPHIKRAAGRVNPTCGASL
jgi:hypothetical protein